MSVDDTTVGKNLKKTRFLARKFISFLSINKDDFYGKLLNFRAKNGSYPKVLGSILTMSDLF